jgi:MscS family membrane protein
MTSADRSKNGPEIARELEDLLDDTPFSIATLSRDPEGDQSDGLSPELEELATFKVDGRTLQLQLERVQLKSGFHIWVVSADSIPLISEAHQLVGETPFEKKLPKRLVTFEILDTAAWRWIALFIMAIAVWILSGLLSWALISAIRRLADASAFRGPLRT